jgi:hypothetical protein
VRRKRDESLGGEVIREKTGLVGRECISPQLPISTWLQAYPSFVDRDRGERRKREKEFRTGVTKV